MEMYECEVELYLKFSAATTIVLINKGLKRKHYTLTQAFTRKIREFTRVGMSFSAGRWMSFFGTTAFKYSPAGWTVEYHPDIDWHRISPWP